MTPDSFIFQGIHMHTIVPYQNQNNSISLTAWFNADPDCAMTNSNAGVWKDHSGELHYDIKAQGICSVCVGQVIGQPYPSCHPDESPDPTDPCEDFLNYVPDPLHPEYTPLQYLRVVVHIFQKEDPDDPGNFTPDHLDVIRSWFNDPDGVNGMIGNMPDDTTDFSPHVPDTRIRFLNYGIEGYDVFFHKDNKGWGMGYYCGGNPTSFNYTSLYERYVQNPDSTAMPANYYEALKNNPDVRNALHLFVAGVAWHDTEPKNVIDSTDCLFYCPGGYSYSHQSCFSTSSLPATVIHGTWYSYLEQFSPGAYCEGAWPGSNAALGRSISGEIFHLLGLDHPSPLQAHWVHEVGTDGCDDTPEYNGTHNLLGCNYGNRYALTECQTGRMLYQLARLKPFVLRYPDSDSTFNSEGNCVIVDDDIVINDGEDVTWLGKRELRTNVIVRSGGKLTIRCDLGMPGDATIMVEPGGKLYVYGKIYNNCEDQPWTGLIVEGNKNLPQTLPPSDQQGFLRLLPGSIIEGAKTSIDVTAGGMVIATGCTILNSGGMLFAPYPFPQKSWFSGCDFICDGNIYDFGGNPFKHAELHAVNNLRFIGCNFSVSNVPAGQLSKTAGIVADGSMFRVYSGSTFRGFDTGIHAAGQFSPFNAFTVTGCTFSNNQTGIYATGMQNFTVTKNTFEVGGTDFQSNNPCGLMMYECTGYTVEENTFYGKDDVATGRYGTMTENSGDDANFIQGNTFHHLEYANWAQGDNRGDQQGLQYLCNGNGDNPNDFYVDDNGEGIHTIQGNGKATMNTFSHLGGDFTNNVGEIVYYYKENDPAHEPQNPTGLEHIPVQPENTCPSDEPPCDFPCKLTPTEWQQKESYFYVARDNWQTEKASLLSLMDGGDTGALLAEINGATSQNAAQVTQHLLSLSPWLSPEALTATINQKQVLTESATVQILNANPEGLREQEVRSLVQSTFSQTVADSILANAGTQTDRTAKEILVGQYRADMLRTADQLIEDILKDTTQVNVPLLRTWLANKQSLEADYAIVASYLSEEDFVTASQKLDAIPQTYSLNAEEMTEHGYFADLSDLWQDAYASGKTMAELDSQGVSAVQYIADNSDRRAGAMAQGIINTWYGGHYRVVPILGGGGGQQGLVAPPTGNGTAPAAGYLSAFPNPARGSVTFRWNLPEGMENAAILLSDLQGKTIEVLEISGQHGKREWGTEKVEHGVYLYRLHLPDGSVETSKLTIIK